MTRWMEHGDFQERLAAVAEATERMLEALLTDNPLAGEVARPARFMTAMRYASLAGGKRLRPFLLVEAASACSMWMVRACCAPPAHSR